MLRMAEGSCIFLYLKNGFLQKSTDESISEDYIESRRLWEAVKLSINLDRLYMENEHESVEDESKGQSLFQSL